MSAIKIVNGFYEAVSMLSNLIPSGSVEIPIGLHLNKGTLVLTCTQGCVYQTEILVDNVTDIESATVLYRDLAPIVDKDSKYSIEFSPISVSICSADFSIELPIGYSTVQMQEFKDLKLHRIEKSMYLDNLNSMLRMNLDKLYGIASPVIFDNDVVQIKYPNTWIEAKAAGMFLKYTFTQEHCRLLVKFAPTTLSLERTGSVIFKKDNAVLQLPCKPVVENSRIKELLTGTASKVTLDLRDYVNKVRQVAKLDNKAQAHIALYEGGLSTSIANAGINFTVNSGNVGTKLISVFDFPIQLWLALLRNATDLNVNIILGGDKLCLQTISMTIVTRVLK